MVVQYIAATDTGCIIISCLFPCVDVCGYFCEATVSKTGQKTAKSPCVWQKQQPSMSPGVKWLVKTNGDSFVFLSVCDTLKIEIYNLYPRNSFLNDIVSIICGLWLPSPHDDVLSTTRLCKAAAPHKWTWSRYLHQQYLLVCCQP